MESSRKSAQLTKAIDSVTASFERALEAILARVVVSDPPIAIAIAYSGGLHHIHAPGEKAYRFFKTIKLNLDVLPINEYNNQFNLTVGSEEWKKAVIADLQHRLETKVPKLDE
jgi:hypothetical protein